ncbi:M3 family oligoendopeptidase [Bacillus sp. FJAT-47783]|uniref:M3 family oligoendopeptidase n=1 Tax=Bacillus sp. FJAT-47783 TaxID=2922712 RepID=UPI001FAD5257|nr:M3 family oligoendopeptidase [Bacillus sp. FJAT-47783]
MENRTYKETWDLDVFFKGGSESEAFRHYLDEIKVSLHQFNENVPYINSMNSLQEVLEQYKDVSEKMDEASAFVECLKAQNTADKKASMLEIELTSLFAKLDNALTVMDQKMVEIPDQEWNDGLANDSLRELSFVLNERRNRAKELLSVQEEMLIQSLAVDGYHSWGQMYDEIVSKMTIPVQQEGEVKNFSVGQAYNKFSDPNREVRKYVFEEWEKAWAKEADLLTRTLNHLAGFRLSTYEKRGWSDVLKEPLALNRMKSETLQMMWSTIEKYKEPLIKYLKRKAELLNVDQLSWYDLDAPVGKVESTVSYQEGAEFILKHFGQFGEKLTKFTERAFTEQWIEAEDRPQKAPGGFCTSFPESEQSRIFMTYSGTPTNVSTLAHELGHAYHQEAMKGVHPLNSFYAMNVAETASTFAELIVSNAAVQEAQTKEEKIALLEEKLQSSVAMFMNIHARFLFETSFYEERKKGWVSTERLNELMTEAQKRAYCGALKEYHPHFWASKLHFYITDYPFYNFPYTFGYLFSLGIYAKALEEGSTFEEKYIALLKDTGSMTVEQLASKHLNVDLTKQAFWENGLQMVTKEVDDFLELTKDLI